VREERAVEVREPGAEPAELGNGEVIEGALGGLAGLLFHALEVGSAARPPGCTGNDGSGSFCLEAGGPQRSPQRPSAAVHPSLAPSFGGQLTERLDQLVIGFVVGRGFRRCARSGGPPFDRFAVRFGAFATRGRNRSLLVGEKLELFEQEPGIEGEPVVEDDGGRLVVFRAATGGVLEVEKAVGLGIEAKKRNGGISLRCGELAVEAEQLAEEAEKRAIEGPEEGGLPRGGLGAIPSVGVRQRGGEPEDEVPVRVTASEEVVGDVELREELVDGPPGPLAIAVHEGGVELGGFGIAAARVEALGVGDSAALALGVDLESVAVHPGCKFFEGARPRRTQPRALLGTSIGQEVACLALPEGATSELRSALQSGLKSRESMV